MPDQWDKIRYPELTDAENEEIRRARRAGYATFFPMFPSAEAQSRNTLAGARTFLSGISPEQRLLNVADALVDAVMSKKHEGRSWEIRAAAVQLRENLGKYIEGKLPPIRKDGCAF